MRRALSVRLHLEQRRQLLALAQGSSTSRRVATRAEIVLRAAAGAQNREIALALGTGAGTAGLWRRRFLYHGVAGITRDAPRPGRPHLISEAKVKEVVQATTHRRPPRGGLWSARSLSKEVGVSKSSVQRIWKFRGIDPQKFRESRPVDPGVDFLEQVTDLVGLYLNPPERAVAFSTDERVRSRALVPRRRDSRSPARRRSRGAEFRSFLQITDRETPGPLQVHLLVDGRLTPTPPEVERWLAEHPRFHVHSLPSDRVGVSLIDRLVDGFSRRKDHAGASGSAQRLKYAIREYLLSHRTSLNPFVWTATSAEIRGLHDRRNIKT